MSTPINGTMLQFFHWYLPSDHKHWNKLATDAKELADAGFTAVWLPPATKASVALQSVGYDIYDLYDLGEFNQKGGRATKYGTKNQYVKAVKTARAAGLQVYIDVVLNHKAGADETEEVDALPVDSFNRNEVLTEEPVKIKAFTKFTFPGRQGKYSNFIWDHNCFTGTDYDDHTQQVGVFRLTNEYAIQGWEETITDEHGNYDYLMFSDVDFRNPAVREELKHWIHWYYNTVGFDGLRLDAIKHIPAYFFNEWLDFVNDVTGQNFVTTVGEFWTADLGHQLEYLHQTEGRIRLFDSCLHYNFHKAAQDGRDYDLSTIFDNTLVQASPLMAVTLVDNHDTQPLQALESFVDAWFKPLAYALILLRQDGYPCVFYPDVYGARYRDRGNDGKKHTVEIMPCEGLEKLVKARQLFAYGEQKDYFDHGNCIGWVRCGTEDKPGCAVVLSNGDDGFKRMEMGVFYANTNLVDLMGYFEETVTTDDEGWADFPCRGGKVSVWVRQEVAPSQEELDAPLSNEREMTEPPVDASEPATDVSEAQEASEAKQVHEELLRDGMVEGEYQAEANDDQSRAEEAHSTGVNVGETDHEDAAKAHS